MENSDKGLKSLRKKRKLREREQILLKNIKVAIVVFCTQLQTKHVHRLIINKCKICTIDVYKITKIVRAL